MREREREREREGRTDRQTEYTSYLFLSLRGIVGDVRSVTGGGISRS